MNTICKVGENYWFVGYSANPDDHEFTSVSFVNKGKIIGIDQMKILLETENCEVYWTIEEQLFSTFHEAILNSLESHN